MEGPSTESLIATTKVIFAEYGILHKIMSDTSTNFVSDKVQKVLQQVQHQASSVISISPPEQWAG